MTFAAYVRIVGTKLNAIVHIHKCKHTLYTHTHSVKEIISSGGLMANPWALRVAGQNFPAGSFSQQAPTVRSSA